MSLLKGISELNDKQMFAEGTLFMVMTEKNTILFQHEVLEHCHWTIDN